MTTRNVILGVLVLAVQALTSLSVAAQIGDPAFRYFLVPLMVTGPPETGADPLPGAHGSLWSSRLLAFNEGDKPIQLTIGGDHCARELAGTEETSVRVEIAFPPGLKFWTFASVTHNETQHVTIVTP